MGLYDFIIPFKFNVVVLVGSFDESKRHNQSTNKLVFKF